MSWATDHHDIPSHVCFKTTPEPRILAAAQGRVYFSTPQLIHLDNNSTVTTQDTHLPATVTIAELDVAGTGSAKGYRFYSWDDTATPIQHCIGNVGEDNWPETTYSFTDGSPYYVGFSALTDTDAEVTEADGSALAGPAGDAAVMWRSPVRRDQLMEILVTILNSFTPTKTWYATGATLQLKNYSPANDDYTLTLGTQLQEALGFAAASMTYNSANRFSYNYNIPSLQPVPLQMTHAGGDSVVLDEDETIHFIVTPNGSASVSDVSIVFQRGLWSAEDAIAEILAATVGGDPVMKLIAAGATYPYSGKTATVRSLVADTDYVFPVFRVKVDPTTSGIAALLGLKDISGIHYVELPPEGLNATLDSDVGGLMTYDASLAVPDYIRQWYIPEYVPGTEDDAVPTEMTFEITGDGADDRAWTPCVLSYPAARWALPPGVYHMQGAADILPIVILENGTDALVPASYGLFGAGAPNYASAQGVMAQVTSYTNNVLLYAARTPANTLTALEHVETLNVANENTPLELAEQLKTCIMELMWQPEGYDVAAFGCIQVATGSLVEIQRLAVTRIAATTNATQKFIDTTEQIDEERKVYQKDPQQDLKPSRQLCGGQRYLCERENAFLDRVRWSNTTRQEASFRRCKVRFRGDVFVELRVPGATPVPVPIPESTVFLSQLLPETSQLGTDYKR